MKLVVIGIFVIIFLLGCVSNTQNQLTNNVGNALPNEPPAHTTRDSSHNPSGEAHVEYVPFTQAAYEQAKAENKTIFLEFYASWCPICQAQAPDLKSGLEELHSNELVAFRVNYKDSDTDADEEALARKFNITYQHTHIITNTSEEVLLRSQEQWSKEEVIEKVGAFA